MLDSLKKQDIEAYDICQKELNRQRNTIELIASENIVSPAILDAMSSVLTNKYAEGKPRGGPAPLPPSPPAWPAPVPHSELAAESFFRK